MRYLDLGANRNSLFAGDWVMAGFDLAMLGFGLTFAAIGWHLKRRIWLVTGKSNAKVTATAQPASGVAK
jgi:hypothetical protein